MKTKYLLDFGKLGGYEFINSMPGLKDRMNKVLLFLDEAKNKGEIVAKALQKISLEYMENGKAPKDFIKMEELIKAQEDYLNSEIDMKVEPLFIQEEIQARDDCTPKIYACIRDIGLIKKEPGAC